MSEPVMSAVEKARGLLRLRESLAGAKRTVHRALLIDNGERGSAQQAATFDADDLAALMMDLREVEAKNDLLREANFALVNDLSALRVETLKDAKRLNEAHADMERLQALLRQLSKDGRVLMSKESLVGARVELADLRTARAEVERAFRAGYMYGEEDEQRAYPLGMDAAWSRYQQEKL